MRRLISSAVLALGSMFALASGADAATTYSYTCTNTAGELQLRLNGSSAWTHTNGGAGTTAKPVAGDTIAIDGTTNNKPCLGDIFVGTSNLTFKNHSGTNSLVSADAVNGMFEVAGARNITIDGIALTCSGCSTSTTNTTGLSTFAEDAALLLHDGAAVLLENGSILAGNTSGIFITRNATIAVISEDVSGNGLSGADAPYASGIFAENQSSVRLGNRDGSGSVTIAGNGKNGGGCPGFGILLATGSALNSFAATIGGTGIGNDDGSQNTCGQILLQTGSSAWIQGNTITANTANQPAVQAQASSSLTVTSNPVPQGTTISASSNGAVLLGGASSAVLNNATIRSSGTSVPTVEASASSTVALAGGNTITALTVGGIVLQIDHSSSLVQADPFQFGFFPAAETLTGSAFIQVQSSIDIGDGVLINTTSTPTMNWSVTAGNCILVQQNSSFRMSGGAVIAGNVASPCILNGDASSTTITIQQESNAFFNLGLGSVDAITGGGGVSCAFAGFPNAHVNGKGNISPAGAQPVMIGSWSQANAATSPGCLGP